MLVTHRVLRVDLLTQNSRQNFSLQHQYNINLMCDKNKENYQFGDN